MKKSMILPPSEGYTVKILEKFCELTSLHGFAFLNNANSIAVKLVWVFAIIAIILLITYFYCGSSLCIGGHKCMEYNDGGASKTFIETL